MLIDNTPRTLWLDAVPREVIEHDNVLAVAHAHVTEHVLLECVLSI